VGRIPFAEMVAYFRDFRGAWPATDEVALVMAMDAEFVEIVRERAREQ